MLSKRTLIDASQTFRHIIDVSVIYGRLKCDRIRSVGDEFGNISPNRRFVGLWREPPSRIPRGSIYG